MYLLAFFSGMEFFDIGVMAWDVLQDGVCNSKESSDQPEWVGVGLLPLLYGSRLCFSSG